MKKITVNKKEYTLEFSIEASLYDECTMSIMDMFVKGGMVQGAAETNDVEDAMTNLMQTIANLPQRTLTVFYAALLEHHGPEGDGSIQSMSDAKRVLADYLKEKKKSFRDVFADMMALMEKDSFFDLIGLNQVTNDLKKEMENPSEEPGNNTSEK